MSETGMYVTLLVVGIALTFLVGRLLVTAGEPFLEEVFQDTSVTRSVNLLLSVLFHLITLGVIAIASVVNIGPQDSLLQEFVVKLGVVLLLLLPTFRISENHLLFPGRESSQAPSKGIRECENPDRHPVMAPELAMGQP